MAQPLWYLRHADKIIGPFPPPRVEELLRTGEVTGDWDISLDEQDWLPLAESGQFAGPDKPRKTQHAADQAAWIEERLRARERWRGDEAPVAHDAVIDEARRQALGRDQARTDSLVVAERGRRPSLLIGVLALLALGGVGVVVWLGQSTKPIPAALNQVVNCAASAGAGINWNGCDKQGAVLAGALLRNAHLERTRLEDAHLAGAILEYASAVGANLRNADLRGAKLTAMDLTGADLSGADLSGANLRYAVVKDALLAGTRLDQAVWSDGRACATGSVGSCL
jgi:hypothetical protein